jgi:hypothetical protein
LSISTRHAPAVAAVAAAGGVVEGLIVIVVVAVREPVVAGLGGA